MEAPHLHQKVKVELAEGYAYRTHFIDLRSSPTPIEFRQLFDPSFWRLRLREFNELDLIRIIAADRSYDLLVCVRSKAPGGLLLSPWPTPVAGTPEWDSLIAGVSAMTEISQAQMAAELHQPVEPPATSKRKAAA